jgi:hypothetical protein
MRALFPPEALEQVAGVIRAKRWGGSGRGRPENLVPGAGQTGTSRRQDRVPLAGTGVGKGPTEGGAKSGRVPVLR